MARKNPTITDWRIIGVSGHTADGREISAESLREMAESYDPNIYAARINLEHMRFLYDSDAGGYGDVVALKAEKWEKDPERVALWAKLSVLPALQNIWDNGEKLHTSMEIQANFAQTGKAYLVGLAITDSPASLGTSQNFSLAAEKAQQNQTQFSQYMEIEMPQPNEKETVAIAQVENIFSKLFKQFFGEKQPETSEKQPENAVNETAPTQADYSAQIAALKQENADAAKLNAATLQELNELKQQFADLLNRLETETASGDRVPHGGANEIVQSGW